MKSRAFKVLPLFLVVGQGAGLLSIFVVTLSKTWGWVGLGAILASGLLISMIIAGRLRWLSLRLSVPQCLSAILIIITAYPVSVLVMIGSALLYGRLYAVLFSDRWHERYYSGDDPAMNEGIITGLFPAAIVGAILVSLALRVVTRKWDRQAFVLMMVAGIATIPLSSTIASLIGERNWHLILFPVGETLFSALCGYWLIRVSPVQEQVVSPPATAREPDHRPA